MGAYFKDENGQRTKLRPGDVVFVGLKLEVHRGGPTGPRITLSNDPYILGDVTESTVMMLLLLGSNLTYDQQVYEFEGGSCEMYTLKEEPA